MRIELSDDAKNGKKVFVFQVTTRPGAWCRPSEWCFGRHACDGGCLVYDVGWFWVEWLRGKHLEEANEA